jgi:hypothetical protein
MTRRIFSSSLVLLALAAYSGKLAAADLLYLVESGANKVSRWNTSGTVENANFITGVTTPWTVAFDSSLNIYLTGFTAGYVAKYTVNGSLINANYITSGTSNPSGIAVNQTNGEIFVVNNGNNFVSKYNSDGSLVNATFQNVATSPDGIMLQGNDMYVVRWASSAVGQYTNTGTSGTTINASFLTSNVPTWRPFNIARDSVGNFYVSGSDRVLKFDSSGAQDTGWVINYTGAYGLAIDSSDNLYVGAFNGTTVGKFASNGSTINANFITGVSSVTSIAIQQNVPEPSTYVLGGLATLVLSAVARRRRQARNA